MAKTEWFRLASGYQLDHDFLRDNTVTTVTAGGKRLCVGRRGNDYFAIDDKCPHAGGSLGQGWCDEKGNVICPHHRYRFNPETGQLAHGKGYYVNTYPVELRDNGLWVRIEKKGWWGW